MTNDKEENLINHLEDLRQTCIKSLVGFLLVFPLVFVYSQKILDFFINIIVGNSAIQLNYFSPIEVFILQIKLSCLVSFVIAYPYIVKQVWNFILPALYDNERNVLRKIIVASSFLFALGIVFCLFVMLPFIVKFGLSFSTDSINPVLGISNIVNLAICLCLAFGIMFQFPIVTYFLIKSGLCEYETIKDKRPYVVVIILIIAGIISPPDVISQLILFIPTYLLFELGLLFSRKQ